MIGLGTNILVRFLTKDDEKQYIKSYDLIVNTNVSCFITYPVLTELIWVLSGRYKFKKEQLVFILKELIVTQSFYFPNRNIIEIAIQKYIKSKADFADCLIGTLNEQQNCQTTYTFDKQTSKLPDFTLLD